MLIDEPTLRSWLLVGFFRNIFRFRGWIRLFIIRLAFLLQGHLQQCWVSIKKFSPIKLSSHSLESEFFRRQYRMEMEVSDFDNNHDSLRACREYLGRRDGPNRPTFPTADEPVNDNWVKMMRQKTLSLISQCSRWSRLEISRRSSFDGRTWDWCPCQPHVPYRPAKRTLPSVMQPSVDTSATALWDYSSRRSEPGSRAPVCDRCNCPAGAHQILDLWNNTPWIKNVLKSSLKSNLPATFLVSTIVFKSASSVMCFDMSVDNTISITILRNVWRCFLHRWRETRGNQSSNSIFRQIPNSLLKILKDITLFVL